MRDKLNALYMELGALVFKYNKFIEFSPSNGGDMPETLFNEIVNEIKKLTKEF